MRITPTVEDVAEEVEMWAVEVGWKAVALAVAAEYHCDSDGTLLPVAESEVDLRNLVQKLRRTFRGCCNPRYAPQAEILSKAAISAMPAERRARLVSPGDPVLLAAIAAKEGIEAVNAVNLGAGHPVLLKEIDEAISAFSAVRAAVLNGSSNSTAFEYT